MADMTTDIPNEMQTFTLAPPPPVAMQSLSPFSLPPSPPVTPPRVPSPPPVCPDAPTRPPLCNDEGEEGEEGEEEEESEEVPPPEAEEGEEADPDNTYIPIRLFSPRINVVELLVVARVLLETDYQIIVSGKGLLALFVAIIAFLMVVVATR
jgi:hypothetical protein